METNLEMTDIHHTIIGETPNSKASPDDEHLTTRERALAALPRVLRYLGAIVLLASALSFAVQGWSGLDSLGRYYTFLGFTLVLSAAGVFCGIRLEEDKGARTFLALAAAFLPAHFIQLGAFVYNMLYGIPANIPDYFVLTVPNSLLAVATLALAVPILAGVAFSGFSAMARAEAKLLTALYLLSNGALLVPSRNANFIGALALVLYLAFLFADSRCFRSNTIMKSWDGIVSRVMLFVPIACMLIRNLMLYPGTALMLSAILAMVTVLLLVAVPQAPRARDLAGFSQFLSFITAGYSWVLFVSGALTHYTAGVKTLLGFPYGDVIIPVTFLPMATVFVAMSLAVEHTGPRYRKLASWIAIGAVLLQLFSVPGIASSFLCIITAVFTVAAAFTAERRVLFYSGAFGLGVGILYHLRYAVDLYSLSPWISLAIVGVGIVVASSYVERNFGKIVQNGVALRSRISSWA